MRFIGTEQDEAFEIGHDPRGIRVRHRSIGVSADRRLTTMGETVPDGVKIPIIKRIGINDRRVLTAGGSTLATETYAELKVRLARIDREMGTEEADARRGDVAMGTAARRTQGKCNYCKRPGHLEAACRKKIADRSGGNGDVTGMAGENWHGNGTGGGGIDVEGMVWAREPVKHLDG